MKKKGINIFKIIIEVVIVIAVIAMISTVGSIGFNYGKLFTTGDIVGRDKLGEDVSVTIPKGSGTKDIADILYDSELIANPTLFRINSRVDEFDGTYKHGTYNIPMGLDEKEIMKMLQKGSVDGNLIKVTIPEGYTAKQIGAILEEKGVVSAEDFMSEVNNVDHNFYFLKEIPVRDVRLEGYLFPDTYFFEKDAAAYDVVDSMLAGFDRVLSEEFTAEIENSKYGLDEIIRIASIIESEIQVENERAIASGVIYNRLEENMSLQMCSTVLYALGIRRDAITLEDLKVESPYNTYINNGLPIGPISNPGEAAIRAAIFPDDNKYLFFVLKAQAEGEHVFTETYEEFLEAKEKYKQQF